MKLMREYLLKRGTVKFLVWLLPFVGLPPLVTFLGLLPQGTEFIPRILLIFVLPALYVSRPSFRAGMGVVLMGAVFSLFSPDSLRIVVDGLNHRMQDAFFSLRGPRKPTGQVVIVNIDDQSLRELGQWPWPRTQMAEALGVLKEDGARVIGFDIVFAEPDRLSLYDWLQRFERMGLLATSPQASGTWTVPVPAIKRVLIEEWERRLRALDPEWTVEPELSEVEHSQAVLNKYLAEQQADWEQDEKVQEERMARAGLAYEPRPFEAPENPLLHMAQHSQELSYLVAGLKSEDLEDKSHPVEGSNDEILARGMMDGRVVVGGLFITPSSAGTRMSAYLRREARRESEGMVISSSIIGAEPVFPGIRQAVEQVLNVDAVQQGALHQGSFNIVPDRSGAARFYTMIMQAPIYQESLVLKEPEEGEEAPDLMNPDNYETKIISQMFTYPSLALEMLRVANGYDQVQPGYSESSRGLLLKRRKGFDYESLGVPSVSLEPEDFPALLPEDYFIPLDFKADLVIDFLGFGGRWQPESEFPPEFYFQYVSVSDVLHRRFEPGTFKNKYVLIGSTDPTLSDLVGSPFRPAFPGLEVHAVVLDNLISQRFLVDHGKWATLYQFLGILVVGSLVSWAVAYLNPWAAALTSFVVLLGLPGISYAGLAHGGVVINFVYPWFCSILLTIIIVIVNFFVEGKDRRFVVSQFSKMVSGDILQKLRDDPGGVSLKGQRAEISVMFSDIANFTTISEKLSPQVLVGILNDYFTPMTEIILENNGFIDKFVGDSIMACWGVPFPDPEHAKRACIAALRQQEALVGVAKNIHDVYGIDIKVRMGIASGRVSAALMGSENRKSYTVMGDVVNLGSRLEPACKDYGVSILLCETTYRQALDVIEARCVDRLVVKGKSIPIPIYELLGEKGRVPQDKIKAYQQFEQALRLHWQRDWQGALGLLAQVLELVPNDGPSLNLKSRIEHYQQHPPGEAWQGEYVRLSKS